MILSTAPPATTTTTTTIHNNNNNKDFLLFVSAIAIIAATVMTNTCCNAFTTTTIFPIHHTTSSSSSSVVSTVKSCNNNNNENFVRLFSSSSSSSSPENDSSSEESKTTTAAAAAAATAAADTTGESLDNRVKEGTHEELMYALGVNLARQLGDVRPLVENGEELAEVAKGLLDTVVGRLNEEGQTMLLARRGTELNELITNRANNIREKLEQAGRDMLQEMEGKENVTKLPSGVLVHVLDHGPDGPGTGQRPTKSSTVKVHYHGTLADGTIFDTTLGGEPVSFPLNGVVPGWREGVLKMHEGETAMIGIPPEQGYGKEGTPDGRIPGGSSLFFKIQLLEVLSAGIGGGATLLGADGQKLKKGGEGSSLLGADGKPM